MEKIFTERLREARGTQSQSESAKKLGISQVRLSNYESGKREPDIATIQQIAKKYDVSADWLLGLTDTRTPTQQAAAQALAPEESAVEKMLREMREKGAEIIGDMPAPQVIRVGQKEKKPLPYPDRKKALHYTMKVPVSSPGPALAESDLERIADLVAPRVLARLTRPHTRHHYAFSKK